MENHSISINVSKLSNGIYFIHISDNNGEKIGIEKIFIKHK